MSRLFVLRGKMRLVKLGAQVVFRNYIDLASHDFCSASMTLVLFGTEIEKERKTGGWRREEKIKFGAFLQYLYLCIVIATILPV